MTAKSCRAENRAKQRATIVTAWQTFAEWFDSKDTEKHIKLPICFCEIVKNCFWAFYKKLSLPCSVCCPDIRFISQLLMPHNTRFLLDAWHLTSSVLLCIQHTVHFLWINWEMFFPLNWPQISTDHTQCQLDINIFFFNYFDYFLHKNTQLTN